jgi:two-component system LytT family response regulator
MKIRAFIVDDEPLARQRIRLLLGHEPDIELLGECSNGPEAVERIAELRPDLLFLDIQMPQMDGFGVLAALPPDHLPLVIFVTAYDQHAIRAFEVCALDYLLKPFKPARLAEAIQRARQRLAGKTGDAEAIHALLGQVSRNTPEGGYLTRLSIKTTDRILFLKTDQVACFESAGNYVVAQTGKESHILRETLNALEGKLNPERFLRVSRSAIVNLDCVRELQPAGKNEHVIILTHGKRVAMTRGLREVEQAIKYS